MSPIKKRSLIVLRWLAFAPVAVAGAALARLVLIAGNRWAMARYVAPDSFLGSTWITFISTVVYTGLLVYLSAYIAPHGKKAVSIIVATLASTVAVMLSVMSLMAADYEATFYSICFAAGACVTSYSIVRGDIEMPDELVWPCDDETENRSCLREVAEESQNHDEQTDGPEGAIGRFGNG